jgi:hypothetical protein
LHLSFRRILFNQIDELIVPCFPVLSDKRILEKFINRYLKLFAQCTCRRTYVPLMIVNGFKIFLLCYANGIQMT